MSDETEKDETLDDLELDDDSDLDSGSDNSAPPDTEDALKGDEKRANDLMSKWQKSEAEKAKLQKEIDRLTAAKPQSNQKRASGGNDATAEFVQFTRENARKQLFDSEPRMARFGLTPDSIAGDSLAEMKASFKAQVDLIQAIESRTRNEVLQEHGMQPEVETGQSTESGKSFASMTDKEFEEFLAERDRTRFN